MSGCLSTADQACLQLSLGAVPHLMLGLVTEFLYEPLEHYSLVTFTLTDRNADGSEFIESIHVLSLVMS